jgi:tRNA A-37 threonylcarbamoyl transferase component Bud32
VGIRLRRAPDQSARLQMALQFAEGVAHMHARGVVWGDPSTRNALLFEKWRLRLCDFAFSDTLDEYPPDLYLCEVSLLSSRVKEALNT